MEEEDEELLSLEEGDRNPPLQQPPSKTSPRNGSKPRRRIMEIGSSDSEGDDDEENDVKNGNVQEKSEDEGVKLSGAVAGTVAVGTFAEGEMGDDDDDEMLSNEVDLLERSQSLQRESQQSDIEMTSCTETEEENGDPRSSKTTKRRIIESSTEDEDDDLNEDEYDTDDSFVDDSDAEVSTDDNDESNSDFEREQRRINSYREPDPYMNQLNAEKKRVSPKRKKKKLARRESGRGKRPRPSKGVRVAGKRRLFNDSEDHGEENKTSANTEDFTGDVQEVSIHRIKVNHYKFKAIREKGQNPEDKIIEAIIKKQNETNIGNDYVEKDVTNYPEMDEEDIEFFEKEGNMKEEPFKIRIFAQVIPRRPALMTAYGVHDVTSQVCHTLTFHYRTEEIFVLTTNQAWNVVQWASDFGFPGKVAARILSREGKVEVTTKGLIGTEFMSKRTHNQIQESNPFDLLTFCAGYTTMIHENASILKLHCFESQRPEKVKTVSEPEGAEKDDVLLNLMEHPSTSSTPKKSPSAKTPKKKSPAKKRGPRPTTKVAVTQAAVRFLKRFRPSDFLAILKHLSRIARGLPTQTMDGVAEEDSSAHVQYLQTVQKELAKDLDIELSTQVHSAIADHRQMASLQNYDFAHKHFTDFFYGREFFLKQGQNNVKHWKSSPPTLNQVIQALRGINELTNVSAGSSESDYKKKLNKCSINYLTHDGKEGGNKKKEKVLNCIQGMFFRPMDNNVYWHIKGLWCQLEPSYILLIQKELLALVQQYLGDPTTLGLKFPWTPTEAEEDDLEAGEDEENSTPDPYADIESYLEQYKGQPNYFVSENPGSDIVDMIKIGKAQPTEMDTSMSMTQNGKNSNSFTLYYIISSLSHKVISQGIRVTKCLTGLRKGESADAGACPSTGGSQSRRRRGTAVGGSEHNLQELKNLYEQVKLKPAFLRIAPTFAEFKRLLTNARIVLGIGRDYDSTRTLEEERAVPITIEPRHIENQLLDVVAKNPNLRVTVNDMATELGLDVNAMAVGPFTTLAEAIHRLMISHELIGDDNYITSKLVALSPVAVPIEELEEFSHFLNEHVIRAFQPPASTFLGKMELIRIKREAMNLGIRQFSIAEISLAVGGGGGLANFE